MSIEQLAKQGRDRLYGGLASTPSSRLRQIRDSALRSCFLRMEETPGRMEHVATIHGKEYVNDAAAATVNATFYTMQSLSGPLVWIAFANNEGTDYSPLRQLVLRKVCLLICVGDHAENLHNAFDALVPAIVDVKNIADAVSLADRCPIDSAKVVLSPASGAHAAAETGKQFVHQVNEL